MSTDAIEQRLRERLHGAVESQQGSFLDVDPYDALETGQRVVRRRRIAAVAGTAAAALALGVGSWAVLSDRAGDNRTLPAVTHSVSGPHARLPLGSVSVAGRTQPLVAVVGVDAQSGEVEFRVRIEDGPVLNSVVQNRPGDEQTPWISPMDGVLTALVPADAKGFVPVWRGGVTQQQAAFAKLADGRIAAAWRTDLPPTGTAFAGVVWTDGDATYSSAGQLIPSVTVDDTVFFVNAESGALGYIRPEPGSVNGSGAVSQAREVPAGQFVNVWVPDPAGESGVYVAFLPPTPEKITVETTAEGLVRDMTTHDLGGPIGLLVIAHVDGPRESVTGVTFPGSEGRTFPQP